MFVGPVESIWWQESNEGNLLVNQMKQSKLESYTRG